MFQKVYIYCMTFFMTFLFAMIVINCGAYSSYSSCVLATLLPHVQLWTGHLQAAPMADHEVPVLYSLCNA